jgi:DNA-binding SARP family transcriptional activator
LFVHDLGFVSLRLGQKLIDGRGMRRKALALLTFLLAQPRGSASPDQLIDALWPDLEPTAATNSLHQTIYFLRRVIDEEYKAGQSPEYLHFESDAVWLDRDLVDAASWRCLQLLSRIAVSEDEVRAILQTYAGQWAADFLYEEWASAYRETLHASFLSVMERIVLSRSGTEARDWRLWVGQRTLLVEPNADTIEAEMIRIYRDSGSNAAAARQYAHYSVAMRDQLGIEPAPLSQL